MISKEYIKNHPGKYPVYSSQTSNNGILGKIATYDYDGEYLTWTTDGLYAGTVFYREGKFNITNICGSLKLNDSKINILYLYFILKNITINYVNKGMGNSKLMSEVMKNIILPIPSWPTQDYIANNLTIFNQYFTEYFNNLENEYTFRQKEFQYYSNQILALVIKPNEETKNYE